MATGVTKIDADPPQGSFIYEDHVDAELLISGTPNHHNLTMMESDDGRVACGVWGCGVYKERIPSFPHDELFVVGRQVGDHGRRPAMRRRSPQETRSPSGGHPVFDFQAPFKKFWMTYQPPPPS